MTQVSLTGKKPVDNDSFHLFQRRIWFSSDANTCLTSDEAVLTAQLAHRRTDADTCQSDS
jgi:hypothetical protein